MNFQDTEERKKLLEALRESKSSTESYELISSYYPGWFIDSFDGYSPDYPTLQFNWFSVCERAGVRPQKILLVSSIVFEKEYTILCTVCEYLTRFGYVVRRVGEFTGCEKCGLAIPCEELWKNLRRQKKECPSEWSPVCQKCI